MMAVDVPPELEQQIANMSTDEWDAFVAKVRAPDQREAFREVASRWISEDRLDAVTEIIHVAMYLDEDGQVDAGKVERQLRALFDGIPPNPPQHRDFGQHRPAPVEPPPGDRGAHAAKIRFGETGYVTNDVASVHPEIAKRFPAQVTQEN